jgi:hypothetical protein
MFSHHIYAQLCRHWHCWLPAYLGNEKDECIQRLFASLGQQTIVLLTVSHYIGNHLLLECINYLNMCHACVQSIDLVFIHLNEPVL